MTSLLEELNRSYEDNHNQEKMTVEKMKEKISDEISPVEKGTPKKFRLGLVKFNLTFCANIERSSLKSDRFRHDCTVNVV